MICKKCGMELPDHAKFCFACGNVILAKRFCHKCGQPIEEKYTFCIECGANLEPAPEPMPEPIPEPAPEPAPEPIQEPETVSEPASEEPPKKKKPYLLWVLPGVAVLAAVLAVVLFWKQPAPKSQVAGADAVAFVEENALYLQWGTGDPVLLTDRFYAQDSLYIMEYGIECMPVLTGDGKQVVYVAELSSQDPLGICGELWVRDLSQPEGVKIAKQVHSYRLESGYLYYQTGVREGEENYWTFRRYDLASGEDQLMARNVQDYSLQTEQDRLYYLEDNGDLYLWHKGNKERLLKDVTGLTRVYTDGSLYFTRKSSTSYADLVKDPETLEEDMCRFLSADSPLTELCYYDGSREWSICAECLDVVDTAQDTPAVYYRLYTGTQIESWQLGDTAQLAMKDMDELISDSLRYSQEDAISYRRALSVGREEIVADTQTETIRACTLDTEYAWYVVSGEEGNELYRLELERQRVKLWDTNVYYGTGNLGVCLGDELLYYKNPEEAWNVELYANRQILQDGVSPSSIEKLGDGVIYSHNENVYYYGYDNGPGQLTKLGENVHSVAADGEHLYYIREGALYWCEDDKKEKIAENVNQYTLLDRGNVLYTTGYWYDGQLWLWDGQEAYQVAEHVFSYRPMADGSVVYKTNEGVYRYQNGDSLRLCDDSGEYSDPWA